MLVSGAYSGDDQTMEQERKRPYPMPCPVCRSAMVGEKSQPEQPDYDSFHCLNCGTVVIEDDAPEPEA